MTTIEEIDDSGLTTDARPQAPRDKEQKTTNTILDDNIAEEKSHFVEAETTQIPRNIYKRPKQAKPKLAKTSPIANIINIANCNGVHIGKSISYNIQKPPSKFDEKERHYVKTDSINKLLNCNESVTRDHILFVSSHVGEGWKDVGRLLNYSEGQIYQFEEVNIIRGVKEVVYQLLLDWIQNEPETATIARLTNVLWEAKQEDAVQRFSKKFVV